MKALAETLELFAPPRWLMLTLAAALAATLLAAYVDTLQESVKRGEELRAAQRIGAVRQAVSTVADATLGGQQQDFGQPSPATLHR